MNIKNKTIKNNSDCFILGTRPTVIKFMPLIKKMNSFVIHTGQHSNLADDMFKVFDIKPDVNLNLMVEDQTLEGFLSESIVKISKIIKENNFKRIWVHGDTTSALAGAIVATTNKIQLVHNEAGLRTYDKNNPFPEEIFRTLIDDMADIMFAPTKRAMNNLKNVQGKKFLVGNTVVDALEMIKLKLPKERPIKEKYVLATVHRRESFGNDMFEIFSALKELSKEIKVILPAHPNPNVQKVIKKVGLDVVKPMNYLDFLWHLKYCEYVISDSISADTRLYWKSNNILKFGTVEEMSTDKSERLEVLTYYRKGKKYGNRGPSFYTAMPIWKKAIVINHGIKDVYFVELNNGKNIKVTKDHSLFSTGKKYDEIIPQTIENAKTFISTEYNISINKKSNKEKIKWATFGGLWIADGSWNGGKKKNGICISTGDNKKIISFLRTLNEKWHDKGRGDFAWYSVENAKKLLKLGYNGYSSTKRVPKWLFTASDDLIEAFLRGYFSGDGSCYKHQEQTIISASSINRKLIDDIQILLSRLGIKVSIDKGFIRKVGYINGKKIGGKNKHYKLNIYRGWAIKKFLEKIGFIKDISDDIKLSQRNKNKSYFSAHKIRKIEYVGKEQVFDLKVEDTNTFIANGFYCHNSGGLQEEAPSFKNKVIILRKTTERQEVVEKGYGILIKKMEKEYILKEIKKFIKKDVKFGKNPFGDGKASDKIINIIQKFYN